jgi:hypothetical protein
MQRTKLDGMADAFVELQNQAQATDLTHAEWLALLLDREAADRNAKRFQVWPRRRVVQQLRRLEPAGCFAGRQLSAGAAA